MHAKPDLRVRISNEITGSGSVITDVIRLNMHPPLEIVFRDCNAENLIAKLTAIGCDIVRLEPPNAYSTDEIVRQPISLSLHGVEPFHTSIAWKQHADECSLMYMPLNAPMKLSELLAIPLAPITGLFELLGGPAINQIPIEQQAINDARQKILETLKSDRDFLCHSYISWNDFQG